MKNIKTILLIILIGFLASCENKTDNYYLKKAVVCDSLGEMEEAMSYYNKAIELNPNNAEALCKRGYLKQFSGSTDSSYYREALDDLNKAIKLRKSYAEAIFKRGTVYFNMKRGKNACQDWNTAISLGYLDKEDLVGMFCK